MGRLYHGPVDSRSALVFALGGNALTVLTKIVKTKLN
jgi:hypothetical protein